MLEMLNKNLVNKSVTLLTAVAVWCVYSMAVLAAPTDFNGEITVTGDVSVNGQKVVSGASVVSGSIITTGEGGTATISLGKTGRVELSPKSSLTLRFNEAGITGILNEGKIRVANTAGVAASIATKNAAVIADSGQANNFEVEVECSHTHVDTFTGLVTLRAGSNDRQVAAGTDAIEGNLSQSGCQPCVRPGPGVPTASIGTLPLIAILLAAAGGVGTAVILGSGTNTTTGGGTTVVSNVR
jgi:hypothetical protein